MSGRPEALDRGSVAGYRDGLPFLGSLSVLGSVIMFVSCTPWPQGVRRWGPPGLASCLPAALGLGLPGGCPNAH